MMPLYERSHAFPLITREGLNGAIIKLSTRGFYGTKPALKNLALLEMFFVETRRIFSCSSDGTRSKVRIGELPTEERSLALTFDEIMSQHESQDAIRGVLSESRLDHDWKEYLGRLVPQLANELVRTALAMGIETMAFKAEINMFSTVLDDPAPGADVEKNIQNLHTEPLKMCYVCLAEIWPQQEAKQMPCGHTYHSDCTQYYDERGISCIMCNFDSILY